MTQHRQSDPLAALLAHNAWANRRLLSHCEGLGEDELHQRFDIGPGSVHDTIAHVIGAMYRWVQRIRGERLPSPRFEGATDAPRRFTLDELKDHHELAHDQIVCLHHALRDDGALTRVFHPTDASDVELTTMAALIHVATHGVHHRAQCLNMLRHLGAPGPDLDTAEWAELTHEAVES